MKAKKPTKAKDTNESQEPTLPFKAPSTLPQALGGLEGQLQGAQAQEARGWELRSSEVSAPTGGNPAC